MRKLLLLTLAGAALLMTACNTIAGAGQDISAAGRAVSQTAKDATR